MNLRSNHPEVFCKKGVLRNFTKFAGKHLCRSLFLIKLQAFRAFSCNFIKKRLQQKCFLVIFAKLTLIFQNTHLEEHLQTAASVMLRKLGKLGKLRK